MIELHHAYKVTARGKVYWYAWRGKGAPRLTGAPGSPEFIRSYEDAHRNRKGGDGARMSGLCAMFRASDPWNGRGPKPISAKTKASWTRWLDRIQDEFGDLPAVKPAALESAIHKRFAHRRVRGEWFADVDDEISNFVLMYGYELEGTNRLWEEMFDGPAPRLGPAYRL